jgi:hypothetical protein
MKMNNSNVLLRRLVFVLAATSSLFVTEIAYSQWVFVARHAIGRIEQVTQNQSSPGQPATEVVTVILDAPAQRVYDVAINTIQKNQNVNIVSADANGLSLKISQDSQIATLSVRSLSDDSSQLVIVGPVVQGQNSGATRIAQGVINICNGLGKECKLSSQ